MLLDTYHIFSTSRGKRNFYKTFLDENTLLPKALNISEFLSLSIIVKNKTKASEILRYYFMFKACKFENFKNLNIPNGFLAMLKTKDFIFKFLEEFANENMPLEVLYNHDIYEFFKEQVNVFEEVLKNYTNLLNQYKLFDKITLPNEYELNEAFLSQIKEIIFYQDGYLSGFELELFLKIAKNINFKIQYNANKYNEKMTKKYNSLGFDIKNFGDYNLNLSDKKTTFVSQENPNFDIYTKSFSNKTLQAGFIYSKIYELIAQKVLPEEIVVILPDESFAKILKNFNGGKNLNFAMGFDEQMPEFFIIHDSITKKHDKSYYEIKRYNLQNDINSISCVFENNIDFQKFCEILKNLSFYQKYEEILVEVLVQIEILFLYESNLIFKDIYFIFLNEISTLKKDDTKGGKITVMGVLESRGMDFKYAIIADFNDNIVPKASSKDLFLSSELRAKLSMPNFIDRQNLQRLFYYNIFKKTDKTYISYVEDNKLIKSKFLNDFLVKSLPNFDEKSYLNLMIQKPKKFNYKEQEIVAKHDFFSFSLSSARLKTFLVCPRRYYYKYIQKLKEDNIVTNEIKSYFIGNELHQSLKLLYEKDKFLCDENEFKKIFLKQNDTSLIRYEKDIWLHKMQKFFNFQKERKNLGYKIQAVEENLSINFEGVILNGTIDRIDITPENFYEVIDYKSGQYKLDTKRTKNYDDYQLAIYAILKNTNFAGIFDLEKSTLYYEEVICEKKESLKLLIKQLKNKKEFNFVKTDKKQNCKYCLYQKLCDYHE